ncbi:MULTISPECIES: transcriptional regulator BetI [unclassified Halomonas]|uniref:transcriptional regulator BetI n=1 Tax=unclassified Halomonas TaxID=2609666 RepID=UPI002884ADCE|nr:MULTISPECIES: transcriptional regulator BetI [unclassified Halomonas]MDT0502663.1 transcriptional regulator BetI [Halomonas sp. PAR7]MDT0510945.1 transcriptional regulator BetI [Halomonas sp. LES1]MDT0592731.1 transcriptional regulator BetI [Halomonas sp. PAR8]
MPKVGMEPIRRQQLIKATMAAIDEVGLADATVARIARHAGVSAGIISHYFGGKDGLLEATMRQILSDLGEAVAACRRELRHDTPRARLEAIIEGNFDRSQVTDPVAKTWLAFWASSMHKPRLARLQQVNDRRLYSNLCAQFRRLMPLDEARLASRTLAAVIDGLWLRGALTPEGLDAEGARQAALATLDRLLAASDSAAASNSVAASDSATAIDAR